MNDDKQGEMEKVMQSKEFLDFVLNEFDKGELTGIQVGFKYAWNFQRKRSENLLKALKAPPLQEGIDVGIAMEKERSAKLLEALKFYQPIVNKISCTHDDSSWCSEWCGDGGKRARKAIAEYEK